MGTSDWIDRPGNDSADGRFGPRRRARAVRAGKDQPASDTPGD